jgi:hypothetical protein
MSNHNDKNALNSGEVLRDNPEPSFNKKCNHCKETKPLSEFHKSKRALYGVHNTCKLCRQKNARRRYVENPFKSLHRTKKSECKKKGIPYNLTEEYLKSIWTDECPITGVKLEIANKVGEHHKSAWLDRIDPDGGYVQGNVAFISGRINRIKYNATIRELELLLDWMKKVQRLSERSTT